MKVILQNTLIVGAIAALLAGPTWAAGETQSQSSNPTRTELGQPERNQSPSSQPMNQTPRSGAAASASASAGSSSLYARSADDLEGMKVVDSAGDKVGTIKQIVLAADRKSAHAVISSGGFLGIGATDILVSLDKLTPVGDNLQMRATKEDIVALKDKEVDRDKYAEVKGSAPISGSIVEFSAFEPGTTPRSPGAAPMTPRSDTDRQRDNPGSPMGPR
ncbi:PRC-barrel domain-containing protein [Pseudothauera lacus]|nr:PRC-barrel domain-containing protein [Pseudothauera lacus]